MGEEHKPSNSEQRRDESIESQFVAVIFKALAEEKPITNDEIRRAFDEIVRLQESGYDGKPRRAPFIMSRLREFFGRGANHAISKVELRDRLNDTTNTANKVTNAISKANRLLEENGSDLRIKPVTVYLMTRTKKNE